MPAELQDIRSVLDVARNSLFQCSNVVATGVGYKVASDKRTSELCLVCSVTKKIAERDLDSHDVIPKQLDGIATDVVASGIIRAHNGHQSRMRPAPGGVSLGHFAITAGTLGCTVRRNGQPVILSNNHVMANSNAASIGDAILQPGPADGGVNPDDRIAVLEDFVQVRFRGDDGSGCAFANGTAKMLNKLAEIAGSQARLKAITTREQDNLVDAAIARPVNDNDVLFEILEVGEIAGLVEADLGMSLIKSGRTTGLTTGEVEQIDVTVDVQFGFNRVARFADQFMAGAMSQGGDSGSAVLDSDRRLVGLLFAGSETTTIMNRIQNVFTALDLTL